jgi:hypothetical protein
MRRCLIAILMALALAFAAAGCGPPHIKVPVPHVREQIHDFKDSDLNNSEIKNLYDHAPRGEPSPSKEYTPGDEGQPCYDEAGVLYSYGC